jgi:hypothetical protein
MESKSDYFEDLKIIKKVMEDSSRFLSLSGLSGLFAGLIALAGVTIAIFAFLNGRMVLSTGYFNGLSPHELNILKIKLMIDALIVLGLAVGISLYFSYRKSVKKGIKIWTPVSRRMLINFFVPLATGGIFIIILYLQDFWQFVIPSMLIFYGLALVNAGKFTYSEVFYLGLIEITTGLLAALFSGYGIFFWAFGFGLLHIIYGLIMYRKYEG